MVKDESQNRIHQHLMQGLHSFKDFEIFQFNAVLNGNWPSNFPFSKKNFAKAEPGVIFRPSRTYDMRQYLLHEVR
ncbi:hypothetical protein [Noviherbaspirillum galbum]|uniref:Uncharacterized protein n=1 Tax=Noviherbaspirillum galbum TaxID=2709383 RepID=A0A6B3SWQ8_9BURK|nr:hypothetical protein [Noviherbaspirillum galbum]NEX63436.1 hypothetical protein [Noviherbaspirillum galbum]